MTVAITTMDDITKRPDDPYGPSGGRGIRLTEQQLRARRARSIAIALALGAFVVLIFVVTIVRLGSGALSRPPM